MADENKNPPVQDGGTTPKAQKRLFKKKRAGVVLTEDEVKEIKAGRKRIRKELRAQGIKSRKDFETTASSLGLYFDKHRWWALLLWFFHGKWLWALLGAMLALLLAFFIMSLVTQMRGHFTINMTSDLFREGFSVCENEEFDNPSSMLYSIPLEGAMCVSIANIPEDVLEVDGYYYGEDYFAYTFYIRNDGESIVDYEWEILINSESYDLSKIEESKNFLMEGRVDFEFRTTLVRELHTERDIYSIGTWLEGDEKYFLQGFEDSGDLLSKGLSGYDKKETEDLLKLIKVYIKNAQIRG